MRGVVLKLFVYWKVCYNQEETSDRKVPVILTIPCTVGDLQCVLSQLP